VVSSDNVYLDVDYSLCVQHIIQQEATHFMFTHNSIVFVVPQTFQTLQSRKITYRVDLTNLSFFVVEKMTMTAQVKAMLTDKVKIGMFHMMIKHPTTQVECVQLLHDD
jgi:hypothetical protein